MDANQLCVCFASIRGPKIQKRNLMAGIAVAIDPSRVKAIDRILDRLCRVGNDATNLYPLHVNILVSEVRRSCPSAKRDE